MRGTPIGVRVQAQHRNCERYEDSSPGFRTEPGRCGTTGSSGIVIAPAARRTSVGLKQPNTQAARSVVVIQRVKRKDRTNNVVGSLCKNISRVRLQFKPRLHGASGSAYRVPSRHKARAARSDGSFPHQRRGEQKCADAGLRQTRVSRKAGPGDVPPGLLRPFLSYYH